jgi:hypothetical protein
MTRAALKSYGNLEKLAINGGK